MYYEVYIDAIFGANLLMDYILLRLVGMIFRCRRRRVRYLLGAVIGALFSCLILYIPTKMSLPAAILFHGACAMGMLTVGCGLKKGGLLVKGMVTLYLTAFLMGGFWEAAAKNGAVNLKTFLMFAGGTYLGLSALVYLSDSIRAGRKNIFPITLSYQGKVQPTYGFYDTGNLLCDLCGGPVSIVEPEILEALLSGELVDKLKHLKENPGELKSTEFAGLHPRFLPYRTVGQEEGVLLAVTLEDLCIHTPKDVVHIDRPVFALSMQPSALGNECKVLLNARILY